MNQLLTNNKTMKKLSLIVSLTATSFLLSFPAFSATSGPHGHVTASKNNTSSDKGVTVTKSVTTKKGTISKTTYTGADTGVGMKEGQNGKMHYKGVVQTTTIKGPDGKTLSKSTRVVNTTGTGDGASNGDRTVTKFTTVTAPNGESKSIQKSKSAPTSENP